MSKTSLSPIPPHVKGLLKHQLLLYTCNLPISHVFNNYHLKLDFGYLRAKIDNFSVKSERVQEDSCCLGLVSILTSTIQDLAQKI